MTKNLSNTIRTKRVDAFTTEWFRGNAAEVCLVPEEMEVSSEFMQSFAMEMNLSETVFLKSLSESYEIRWFTPKVEVDLCGHATLAAAHAIWDWRLEIVDVISFSSKSGTLYAKRDLDDSIWLDFPASEVIETQDSIHLPGVDPVYIGRSKYDLVLELATEKEVRDYVPDADALMALDARGVILTAPGSDPEFDFVSRFFGPKVGILEDPVTGSAHGPLFRHWSAKLGGKKELKAYQASKRGGVVRVKENGEDRVFIGGNAVTITNGEICRLPKQ